MTLEAENAQLRAKIAALEAVAQPVPEAVERDDLLDAALDVIAYMADTYKARNGRMMGIEADDGEKCWIVHSDQITALEAAVARRTNSDLADTEGSRAAILDQIGQQAAKEGE